MNQRGQAFVEALILSCLITTGIIITTKAGLTIIQNLIINEFVENTLICSFEKNKNCLEHFKKNISPLNIKILSLSLETSQPVHVLKLKAETKNGRLFIKESELTLDLSFK